MMTDYDCFASVKKFCSPSIITRVRTEQSVRKCIIARVCNNGSLIIETLVTLGGDFAAVRISMVSVIARCPQGES